MDGLLVHELDGVQSSDANYQRYVTVQLSRMKCPFCFITEREKKKEKKERRTWVRSWGGENSNISVSPGSIAATNLSDSMGAYEQAEPKNPEV